MKIGISSYAFRWSAGTKDFVPPRPMGSEGFLEKSAELGAEAVQFCENISLVSLGEHALESLASRAAELGIRIETGFRFHEPAELRRALEITRRIDSDLLRLVMDMPDGSTAEDAIAVLSPIVPDLERAGVTLALENHFAFDPVQISDIVRRLASRNVGVCFDPVNSITHFYGPREVMEILLPYAVCLHLKDARIIRGGTGFFIQGCRMGEGRIPLAEIYRRFESSGRPMSVHVEGWFDPLESIADTIRMEEDMVRHSLQYVRSIE